MAPSAESARVRQARLDKIESLAMLQQPLDAASSDVDTPAPQPKPVALRLALRRGRLAIITVAMVVAIAALAIVFRAGFEIDRFETVSMTNDDQVSMVDTYNSYSGYVSTAFGKPIELFVTTTVQVIALRLMASFILRPEPNWKVAVATLALGAGVGYLINNGFNALNVQLHQMDVQPVISASDLSAADFANAAYVVGTSNMTYSVAESGAENPTTNTLLRNFMLPRAFKKPLQCTIGNNETAILTDDTLEYGLSQRDWMKTMLPEALGDGRSLRIVMNPTNSSANTDVDGDDLPMNATLAATLVLNTMFLSSQFVPWGQNRTWDDDDDLLAGYQTDATNPEVNVSTAVLAGLLPSDLKAAESTKREYFISKFGAVLTDRFQETTATVLTNIPVTFTHLDLSSTVSFDAITFEVDVVPSRLASVTVNNNTRYTNLLNTQCGPFPGHCLIAKKDQPPSKPVMPSDLLYDAPAQIHAFAVCVDDNGTEALQSTIRYGGSFDDLNVNSCPSTSNSSLLLVSVAKRMVADALTQNAVGTASGIKTQVGSAVITNLRKIYSFTVARLGWGLQDLATEYGAVCNDTTNACLGLTFALNPTSSGKQQKVVVGSDVLPVSWLTPPRYSAWASVVRQRPVTLAQINEPPKLPSTAVALNNESGDLLLPHNIATLVWNATATRETGDTCSTYMEDRLQLVLNNHMYMERSLQPTYTAGMFFLFQQSVVKDVVPMGNTTTLQFDRNVMQTVVWISIPTANAILTLAGCVVLALGVVVVLIWPTLNVAKRTVDPLSDITTAHVIAHVMLDEDTFPPFLVHRQVVTGTENVTKEKPQEVDRFMIGAVSLQEQDEHRRRDSASVRSSMA